MCVGQPGACSTKGRAPADSFEGPVAEAVAAGLVEVFSKGLSNFPAGAQRAEECGKRRRALASKLWELQGAFQEVAALAKDRKAQRGLAPLLQRSHGCCIGMQQAAAMLKAQELQGAEAADAATAWSSLEAAISVFEGQVQRVVAAQANPAEPPRQEPRCGCLAGLLQLWAKPREVAVAPKPPVVEQKEEEEAPAPVAAEQPAAAVEPPPVVVEQRADPADSWTSFSRSLPKGEESAPRVLCSDSYVAEALLVGKCNGVAPAVTCIIEDPTQAQRLSFVVGAAAGGAIIPGSPRTTLQHLAEQGRVFDAVVLEEPLLAELPPALLAPGGRAVPRASLPTGLGKLSAWTS